MAKKQAAKEVKKEAVAKKPSTSKAIATGLQKHFPKDAAQIVEIMVKAASASPSWTRKLARLSRALEHLQKAGA